MAEDNSGDVFGGSVDRSKLEEMKAAAGDDPTLQAQVAEVQAQVDAVAESDAAAEEARQRTLDARGEQEPDGDHEDGNDQSPEQQQQEQGEDLSSLSKSDLVDRANAAGISTSGKNKDELVDELNRQRS